MEFNNALLGSVTVWYNPEPSFIKNVDSYSGYSQVLVIVDNSVSSNEYLFNQIIHPNKIYLWYGENMGIAKALNQGLQVIINNQYKFALTLDQDSFFEKAEIEKLLAAAEKLNWENVGILSPIHVQQKSIPQYNTNDYTAVTSVMTSGNILNFVAVTNVGMFNEAMFIDHVDNEYCLRLNKAGYKVLLANAFLTHELGKYKEIFLGGKKIGGFISHSPERLYFFARNSAYILKKYFFVDVRYSMMEVTSLLKRFLKLFFEEDTKIRLSLYFKGLRDSNRMK